MNSVQLPLMIWFSPSFPVGAFAYSHGLEWAQEAGDVTDAASLEAWLVDLVQHGALRNDAILLSATMAALEQGDATRLRDIAELALAMGTSSERRNETLTQGNAFMLAASASWACEALDELRRAWPGDLAYPVAVGAAAQGHGVARVDVLPAFCLGFIANLVSAAVRLGIVGQTDGQRVTAALLPEVTKLAAFAATATLDDLGGAAFRSDLAALRHETQYTRLFRS
ncbi:MAG: urease accessory protein UreF [Bosea sp. (in: a-proteobacteria)]